MPLVEVVGGAKTGSAAIERALAFYTAIGKQPIHIRREVPGHVANRLQAALWRETLHLVAEGIARRSRRMSKKTRRRLDAGLKAKVALEALRNAATIAELAVKYQLHPNQIYAWKKQLLDGAAAVFSGGTGKEVSREAEVNELYATIGQLTVERDFLSRRSGR